MKLRKLALLVITAIFLSSSFFCVSAIEFDNLTAVGIDADLLIGNDESVIQRDEFSYLVASMMSGETLPARETKFADVTAENPYSGYIHFLSVQGIINGVSEVSFDPKGNVSKIAAAKILVHILGYDTLAELLGGYPGGYIQAAARLSLFSGVTSDSVELSRSEALRMMENALLAQNGNSNTFSISEDGLALKLGEKENIFLTSGLGFSVYTGMMTSFNQKKHTMIFEVEKNKYDSNNTILQKNEKVSFTVSGNVDLAHFENVPSTVWVNADDTVVYMRELNGYEIKYGYLHSVNGDESTNNAYIPDSVNRVTLVDDATEYDVAEDVVMRNNGQAFSDGRGLVGLFARLVLKDGEITLLDCWDMQEGGLIVKADKKAGEITYIREAGQSVLRELTDGRRLSIYIDGRSADWKEIKPNSVFNYFKSDDMAILALSERVAVDTLGGIADNVLEIGALMLERGENCYFSTDGITYQKNSGYKELFGVEVEAFFAPDGNVAYVRPESKKAELNEFYGIVSGIQTHSLKEDSKVKLWRVEPEIEERIYTVTDKTKWRDGLSIEKLQETAKDINGEGIYYFKVNSKEEIREVSLCKPFSGYGEGAKINLTSFYNDAIPYVYINDKALYFEGTKIITVTDIDGEFTVTEVPWSKLMDRTLPTTVTLRFFSEEETPEPKLALMTGGVSSLRSVTLHFGIVTEKRKAVNEEGDTVYRLTTLTKYGTKSYTLSESKGAAIKPNTLITFYDDLIYNTNDIMIMSTSDISGASDDWQLGSAGYGLQKGVVRKIDAKRLYLEDETYFMHPYNTFVVTANDVNKTNKFQSATKTDVNVGDTVFYNLYGGNINLIIIVR